VLCKGTQGNVYAKYVGPRNDYDYHWYSIWGTKISCCQCQGILLNEFLNIRLDFVGSCLQWFKMKAIELSFFLIVAICLFHKLHAYVYFAANKHMPCFNNFGHLMQILCSWRSRPCCICMIYFLNDLWLTMEIGCLRVYP
jgi:hypothetical protein